AHPRRGLPHHHRPPGRGFRRHRTERGMTAVLTAPAPATDLAEVSDRPGLRATVSTSFTMAYRGLLKIKHNPEQLFDVTVQPILFTALFTYIFGGAISGSVSSYLPVLIPGILVQT